MNFVVAFKGEAQPIIHYYKLQKVEHSPYPIFQNDQHSLILCGMGRSNAVSATKALHQVTQKTNLGWLNLGIAGHGSFEVGQAFTAGKIIDDSSDDSYYPPQIYEHSFRVSILQTCSKSSSNYEKDLGFDMEAHAFYQTARKFSIRELIQVIKIVSDNPKQDFKTVIAKEVPKWIDQHMIEIDQLVTQIDAESAVIKPDLDLETLFTKLQEKHSFSATRLHQLHNVLRHTKALGIELRQIEELITSATDAKDAMKKAHHFLEPHRRIL
jgi:adenosylhomocysteine nucleosidase